MKALVAGCGVLAVIVASWLFFGVGHGADSGKPGAPIPAAVEPPRHLVVHEWGTFTSFSGSDGVAVGFYPNNTDLPEFIYYQEDENSKAARLAANGTVSMETPVLYFYTDRTMQASVRVDFPRGWITEWYPFAAAPPVHKGKDKRAEGQSMRWDVRLLAGEMVRFPEEKKENRYYQARETDAVPVQTEWLLPNYQRDPILRGGAIVQREKFLFYRGVGTFPPPVTVQALGEGKVRIKNASDSRVGGLVLLTVHEGNFGFKTLGDLDAGAEAAATLPKAGKTQAELAEVMVKTLIAAGLYEKEARAMVKTWDGAWFDEAGTRLLYLVPRTQTDELLPLTVEPKPDAVVRVLVGRHDFLTPEEEAGAERQVQKIQAAQAELESAEKALQQIGRFSPQARAMAVKRLETKAATK